MICDLCGTQSSPVFIEILGGPIKNKLRVCKNCAEKLGFPYKEVLSKNKNIQLPQNNKVCPVCGKSLSEIFLTKQTGCGECYSVFKNEIKEFFKNNSLSSSYSGSMPSHLKGFRSTLTDRVLIQNKLEEAVKKEDYEKAAFYRDYLKSLEKMPVSGGDCENNG